MENLVHLPTGHKFTLHRDSEGVYVLESQQEKGLIVDGVDPNEVVTRMTEVVSTWGTLDELSIGYVANAAHALKLCKEFEGVQAEVLSRSGFGNHDSRVATFITEETKKMSNDELLAAIEDLHLQWDDHGLCFDVESYDRELKAEKLRRDL